MLAAEGDSREIATTTPPLSDVAWTTFATGLPPARHGILGLVDRAPDSYRVIEAAQWIEGPWSFLGVALRGPTAHSRSQGATFWERADRLGHRTVVLRVPYAFPPVPLERGRSLSGVGVPDVALSAGGYTVFTSRPGDPADGRAAPIRWEGDRGRAELAAPDVPGWRVKPVPVAFSRVGEQVRVEVADRWILLELGTWSEPIEIEFDATRCCRVAATVRFLLESIEPELRLFVTTPNIDPRDPILPISWPEDYAGLLAEQVGAFDSLGWAQPTEAYDRGEIDAHAFLAHVASSLEWMRRAVLHEIDQRDAELIVAVFTETDRVSHLFQRDDPDVVDDVYRAMDRIVGDLRRHLPRETLVLLVSDHGFVPFDVEVGLNAWLVRDGLQVRTGRGRGIDGIDWSRTSAWAIGLGQVRLNLRGREPEGIVTPGAQADALRARITAGLRALRGPDGGTVVADVLDGSTVFAGPFVHRASDLLVAFEPGYRSAFVEETGDVAREVLAANESRWSGDHGGAAAAAVAGVLLSSKPLAPGAASLVDVAPTVLEWLGHSTGGELPGRSLVRVAHPSPGWHDPVAARGAAAPHRP